MTSKTRVLIPVKRLKDAKTTFAEVMSDRYRKEMTLSMLEDILTVSQEVSGVESVVVTPDRNVEKFVRDLGFDTILEPDVGLNRALEMAIGDSIESNFTQVLILPADVPLIESKDIESILDLASDDQAMVVTPSKEKGTNALLLRPPDLIDLKFGGESFSDHIKEAQSRGISPKIYRSENLERDIDTPPDLLKVETLGKGTKIHSFLDKLKTGNH